MPLLAPFPWLMARCEKLGHDPAPLPSRTEPPTSGGLSGMPNGGSQGSACKIGVEVGRKCLDERAGWQLDGRQPGVVSDSVPSEASDTASKRFCNEHFLQKTATFFICKVWSGVRRDSSPCLGAQIAVLV